jgi:hypothetical protein
MLGSPSEKGRNAPSWPTVDTLAAALGVEGSAFLQPPPGRRRTRHDGGEIENEAGGGAHLPAMANK